MKMYPLFWMMPTPTIRPKPYFEFRETLTYRSATPLSQCPDTLFRVPGNAVDASQ